jgi:acetyltransferase
VQLNRAGPDVVGKAANAAVPIVRPILPADQAGLQRFIRNLSPASRYLRFMMAIRELPEDMLSRFANPERDRSAALVASAQSAGIIGLAQYVADEAGDGCEVAIVVGDAWQRRGLGFRLLRELLDIAVDSGIRHAHADVLADNHGMRALARNLGCELRTNREAPFLLRISKTLGLPHGSAFGPFLNGTGNDRRFATDCGTAG